MPTVKTIKIIIAALLIGFFLSIQHLALAQSANEAWQLNSGATELFKGGHYSEAEPLAISTAIGGNIAPAIVAIAVLIVASVLLQRWAAVRKEKRIQESLLKKVGLQEVVWVFWATSERWEHACEHLESQIFLVA
jgi:hypothetical protein